MKKDYKYITSHGPNASHLNESKPSATLKEAIANAMERALNGKSIKVENYETGAVLLDSKMLEAFMLDEKRNAYRAKRGYPLTGERILGSSVAKLVREATQ